jgi:hypothetical protein
LSVYAYVCENWSQIPYLIALKKVCKASNANHLTAVVLGALEEGGGLGTSDIARKLLSFGADGVTVFKGAMTGVTKKLQMKHAPLHDWNSLFCASHESCYKDIILEFHFPAKLEANTEDLHVFQQEPQTSFRVSETS